MKRVAVPSRVPTLIDPFEPPPPRRLTGSLVPAPRGHVVRTPMQTLVDAFEIDDEMISDDDILEVIDFDDRVLESGVRAVGERVRWSHDEGAAAFDDDAPLKVRANGAR